MKVRANQFLVWVIASLVAYAGMVYLDAQHGTLRAAVTPQTITFYMLAYVAYLGAIIWVERRTEWPVIWVWITAILARLLLVFTSPTLSDDVYRYLWDGYVAHQGVSPYAYAITDPALDHLDIPQRALANNAWMASPYLPAAQVVFWVVTFAPLWPIFMQLAMVAFDLVTALILTRLLRWASFPPYRLLLYLWNPLVIVEVAHGAHIDSWMVLLTFLAIYFALRPSPTLLHRLLSPVFLALATLTKIIPVLTLPVLFWRWSWRQLVFYVGLTIALLLPSGIRAGWGLNGDLTGEGVFGALRIYAVQWNFNSGLFHWLEVLLGAPGDGAPAPAAQLIALAGMLLVLFVVWVVARRHPGERAALRLMAVPFMAYIALTPTLHPWYILILLAFLPFLPPAAEESRWLWLMALPWLYLSGALIFSYLTYLDPHQFGELEWVRRLEWLPTLFLLGSAALALPFLYRSSSQHSESQEHAV